MLVFGEDVGTHGGVFRITDGLQAEFGDERVFDTPLAEAGIAGIAVGLAFAGWRPVVEMQFDAFSYPAFEQIISHVAKLRNRTRGRVDMPIVIRIPSFGGIGGEEHHCDSPETYYAHTAGLKVVAPSTRARRVRAAAPGDRRPRPGRVPGAEGAYWAKEDGELDDRGRRDRRGSRRAARATTCTLVAYGAMVARCARGRRRAGAEGIEARMVDLRRWRRSTTTCSRRSAARDRPGRGGPRGPATLGMGAEVAARVMEQASTPWRRRSRA